MTRFKITRMSEIEKLRVELSAKRKEVEGKVNLFNELHRRAKYLKKEMVNDNKEIDKLEKLINAEKNK